MVVERWDDEVGPILKNLFYHWEAGMSRINWEYTKVGLFKIIQVF